MVAQCRAFNDWWVLTTMAPTSNQFKFNMRHVYAGTATSAHNGPPTCPTCHTIRISKAEQAIPINTQAPLKPPYKSLTQQSGSGAL